MLEVKRNDGTPVNFQNDEEVAQLFLETVPNNVMRSILFNTKIEGTPKANNMGLGAYGIINVMKRILNTAYVIALCRWKQLRDDKNEWATTEQDVAHFDNSRFTKLFQSALLGEDITVDLQIFSLLELWVDLKKTNSDLSDAFDGIFAIKKTGKKIGVILQAVRGAIKNAVFIKGNYTGQYTKQYCNELCYQLLKAFVVFRGAEVTYPEDSRLNDDEDFCIKYNPNPYETISLYPNKIFSSGKIVASEEQLRLLNGEDKDKIYPPVRLVLYLRAETSAFDGKFQQRYNSFDGDRQTYVQTEIIKDVQRTESNIRDMHETRKFLSFSYKNIREFAMILNDSLQASPDKKRDLFANCQKHYPKIVADIDNFDAPNIYWDNIITLMLLEKGVSEFLKDILCEGSVFLSVLENISWRDSGRSSFDDLLKDHNERVAQINISSAVNRQAFKQKELEMRVSTVLRAMDFSTDDDDERNPFLESLSYKYSRIDACIKVLSVSNNYSEIVSNASELQSIYRDVFMFLHIFYAGVDKYAEVKMTFKKNSNGSYPSKSEPDKIEVNQICLDAFEAAAKEKLDEIKDKTVSQLFDSFCDLCSSYNTFSEEGRFDISEQAKRLKYVITRNYICDAKKLRRFALVDTDEGGELTIFDVLANLLTYRERKDFPKWLNYLKDIFMFLIYNEDYNCRELWNKSGEVLKDKDCDPIYPYIVTYYKENIDRDNVKKCTYRVPLPTVGTENEGYTVTLLTDEEYQPQTYYCIPLRYGSSDSWWINPFLIPKSLIKEIGYPERNKKR